MHLLWVLIVGLVVGVIAKALAPGKDVMGFIITVILGIAGSFLSTFVGERMGWWGEVGALHFLGAIGGAVLLLAVFHALFGRNASA